MFLISLYIGKTLQAITRLRGGRGSALPGYVIERINKHFLAQALKQLPEGVILISGTNGKTTTTKLIAEGLEKSGYRVLTNRTGSNFVRGVISLIVSEATILGRLRKDVAVLEQDEAYAVHFVNQFAPRGVVILNVMRDQMDRFGEIDNTAQLLGKVTKTANDFVVLNDDDSRVSQLEVKDKVTKLTFGVDMQIAHLFVSDDEMHGDSITSPTKSNNSDVLLKSISKNEVTYTYKNQDFTIIPKVSGLHNYQNLATAFLAVRAVAKEPISNQQIFDFLANIEPAFGRGEVIEIDKKIVRLQLVKNPAGFMQSLRLIHEEQPDQIMIAINDDYADGRDMSWLWDVVYNHDIKADNHIITSGIRAYEMAVRLKYDDLNAEVIDNMDKAISEVIKRLKVNQKGIIFCTYTAMLEIRKSLEKQGHVELVK